MLSHLKLAGAALAAHHVTAGAEGGVDLLRAAQHAQQSLPQLLQALLQGPAPLAVPAVLLLLVLLLVLFPSSSSSSLGAVVAERGAGGGRALAGGGPRHQVHEAGVVERPAGVVVHLLGGPADVEHVLLAQVDVLVEEERSQVALEVPAVLHHHGARHRVAPGRGRGQNEEAINVVLLSCHARQRSGFV